MSENSGKNWNVPDWCKAAAIGRTCFYTLSADCAPKQVTVGRRRIVIEDPRTWAERLAVRADSADESLK